MGTGDDVLRVNPSIPGLLNPEKARQQAEQKWDATPKRVKLDMAKGDVEILIRRAQRKDGSINQAQIMDGIQRIAADLGLQPEEVMGLLPSR